MSHKIKILSDKQYSELPSLRNSPVLEDKIKIYLTTILPGLYFSATDKLLNQNDERFLFIPPEVLRTDYSPSIFDDIIYKNFEILPTVVPFEDKIFVPIAVDNIVMGGLVCGEDHSCPEEFQCLLDDFAVSEYFNLIFNINDQLAAGESIAVQILNLMSSHRSFDAFMRSMSDWLVEFMGGGQASFYYRSGDDYVLRKMAGQMGYYEEMPAHLTGEKAKYYERAIAGKELFLPAGAVPDYVAELKSPPAIRFILGGEMGENNNYLLTGYVPNFTSYSYALSFTRLKRILAGLNEKHFAQSPEWHRIFSKLDWQNNAQNGCQEFAESLFQALSEHDNINRLRLAKFNRLENRFEIEGDAGRSKELPSPNKATIPVSGSGLESLIETGKYLFKSDMTASSSNHSEYRAFKGDSRSELHLPIKCENAVLGILTIGSPMTDDHILKNLAIFETAANYLGKLFSLNEKKRAVEIYARRAEELQGKLASIECPQALSELAGEVCHDLNNVMGAVVGRSQLIQNRLSKISDSKLRARIAHDVELIEKSATDAGAILDRLRRSCVGRRESTRTEMSILEVLDDAIEVVRPRWEKASHEKGATILLKKDVPEEIKVLSNPSEIREIFINILLNSLNDFPSGGEIEVCCRQVNETARIVFTDNGVGIPEEIMENVTDSSLTTIEKDGREPRLEISREIIELHGGTINVNSTPGKGTKTIIEMPIHRASEMPRSRGHTGFRQDQPCPRTYY